MTTLRVGMFPPFETLSLDVASRRAVPARIADAGLDHLGVGDHVSFFVGAGRDALIDATALLSLHDRLPVHVALYLLPLRHPVPVARQLATISELAPGRLVLGVGIGGEDPHEVEVCGVDPRTRGRRMDECMAILRELRRGEPVSFEGEFFELHDALILPVPDPPVPLIVGGRSDAAVRRAGRLGDGWLGIWVSPRRYGAVVEQVGEHAAAAGRDTRGFDHALNVWCGFADTREAARDLLAPAMQAFYQMPFEPFERYSPYGTPAEVAEFLAPYVDAGCSAFNLIPRAEGVDAAIDGAAEVRRLLAS